MEMNPPKRRLLILLALAAVLCGLHAWSFHFDIDDAYISFRYAQNLLDGHGLVFNPGDPVEGYSNPLWVLLSAAGMATGLHPLLWARIMGLAATTGLLFLLPGMVRRLGVDEGDSAAAGISAVFLTALCGPVACWTLAGLETPLFGLLMVLAWRLAIDRRPLPTAVVALLLCLSRPDGLMPGVGFMVWSLLPGEAGSEGRKRWLGPAILLAGLAAHFLWRHAYYGQWLPNTYYAKTGDLAGQLRTGIPYGLELLRRYLWPLLAVMLGSALAHRARAWKGRDLYFSLLACLLWIGYTIFVGGDSLGMFRFHAPVLPMLIVCSMVLLARLQLKRIITYAVAAMVGIIILLPSFSRTTGGRERWLVSTHMTEKNLGGWKLAGDFLADALPAGSTIALSPAGYIPWRTGFKTYDLLGLTDTHIAHLDIEFTQGHAGHEKHDGPYILSKRPDYLLMSNVDITDRPRNNSLIPPFERELDIYQCPLFVSHYEQVSFPMPDGKYLNCFRRKGLGH